MAQTKTQPISGKDGKVFYGPGPTELAITKWSLKDIGKIGEVPNTTDGMRRIPGLEDAEGSVEFHVDTHATIEQDLRGNTIVQLILTTNGVKGWHLSAIISNLNTSSAVDGVYDGSFDFKLESGTATFQ